ncbi:hypothetical protein, partial [Pseudomonas sp. 2995-3]|uniref:hypothetical protein n=1 Tax=Pseudomonas sp. 2995-3 TaxID=1712680 RepID=UPI001C453824
MKKDSKKYGEIFQKVMKNKQDATILLNQTFRHHTFVLGNQVQPELFMVKDYPSNFIKKMGTPETLDALCEDYKKHCLYLKEED